MSEILRRLVKAARLWRVPLYRAALAKGTAATIEHEDFLRTVTCRLVVDVGANKGQFALAARRNFPDARILSFEPLVNPAAIFRRVFSADPQTELHQVAIGPAEGNHVIHLSAREDSSSLLPITSFQSELFPGTYECGTKIIHVAPLTNFLSLTDIARPALLKIDVQGFELSVLEGCDILLPAFDYIYVECSFVELYAGQALVDHIISHLQSRGFMLAGVYNLSTDAKGVAIQGDFSFCRRLPRSFI